MRCSQCGADLPENKLDESHDVPKYLFDGFPNERKSQADKFGRRWLCKKCHKEYEDCLRLRLQVMAKKFAEEYFKC